MVSVVKSILLVEDDTRLASLLSELMAGEGYAVEVVGDGLEAVRRIKVASPDLVVLDIGLPGLDGFGVCRAVRDVYPGRILVLTARGAEEDEVRGLRAGADDYLAKPASPPVLLARIENLLRRARRGMEPIRNGGLVIEPASRHVELDGLTLPLGSAEFELLLVLARHMGSVVPRDELYQALVGREYDGIDRSLDLRVSRIRRHLGDDPRRPRWIKTVHGSGYLMAVQG